MNNSTVWQWYHYYHESNITVEVSKYTTKSGEIDWKLVAYDHSGCTHSLKSSPAAAEFQRRYKKGEV